MFNPSENEALDKWFQRLNAPLKRLPTAERAELHLEVRQHLENLVAANQELGSSTAEAWEHALTQFGDPARIGRRLAWEWRRGRGWFSPDMAVVLYGLGTQTAAAMTVLIASLLGVFSVAKTYDPGLMTMLVSAFGVPILAGAALGRKYPGRALVGAFNGALVWPVLPVVASFPMFAADPPRFVVAETAIFAAWWLALTCAAAYLASVTKRGWYKPSLADFKLTLPRKRIQLSR